MTQTESLKLIRFLSAIFQPFGNLPVCKQREIALDLFDFDTGEKILSGIRHSSQNNFCDGEIILTPKNIVSSIRQNIDKLTARDFFVFNTSFNKTYDEIEFYKQLRNLLSEYPIVRRLIINSVRKVNQKYVKKNKDLPKRVIKENVWNLYTKIKWHRGDFHCCESHYCKLLAVISDPATFDSFIEEINDGEFLINTLWSFALFCDDDNFFLDVIKTTNSTTGLHCILAAYLTNITTFYQHRELDYQKTANIIINSINNRPDKFILFAELINVCNSLGIQEKISTYINRAILEAIANFLAENKSYSHYIQGLFETLYKFSSLKGFDTFLYFSSNHTVEIKFFTELHQFVIRKLDFHNLSNINCTLTTINVLTKTFTYSYENKPFKPSLFNKSNEKLIEVLQTNKSFSSSSPSPDALLNLLTIELVVFDHLISSNQNQFSKYAISYWEIFETWLPTWDFSITGNNDTLSKLLMVFNCKCYKKIIEKTLLELDKRPFPLINTLAVIFHAYPDLKNNYAYMMLDYINRYKKYWSPNQLQHIQNIVVFAGLAESAT